MTGVYNPKAFVLHAASLRQAFAHCGRFSTAASRRSLASVSVPVWPANLSVRLSVFALVSHYLTNKLVELGPLPRREARRPPHLLATTAVFARPSGITHRFQWLFRSEG